MHIIKETIKKVKKTILRYGMTTPGDLIVVAVSGGPDSVCLLDILNQLSDELEFRLLVAHFNHGLRETKDESETLLVQKLASSMDLPFETGKASIPLKGTSSIERDFFNGRSPFQWKKRQERRGTDFLKK